MKCTISLFVMFLLFVVMPAQARAKISGLPDFTQLVEESASAVVNISTTHREKGKPQKYEQQNQQVPDIFRHFFGDGRPQRDRDSLGSGFIVSEDGYILTNHHVVKGADEIVVRLSNRKEYSAKLVGSDPRSDLALLQIDARHLPTVKLGRSSSLKVGEWVLAIGSPYGFDHSVTAGIVSAMGRSLPNDNYIPFIQTDVAINPGNSGGPLFNLEGEVVGINSQIYSRTGGFMGLSFAIPIDIAMESMEQIKRNGFVSRGWLGVIIQNVDMGLAESFGLSSSAGALVAGVLDDGPADKAGVEAGDVIITFDNTDIIVASDLPHLVGRVKPGKKAKLNIIRQGKDKTLSLKVGELPLDEAVSRSSVNGERPRTNRLGIQVEELTKERLRELGLSHGVVVSGVEAGPGNQSGIKRGDVILLLNYQKVTSVGVFKSIARKIPAGKRVPVQVNRHGNHLFVSVNLLE
ncbi:MAG: DegQ family serine endoprotease [Pseudomonadales bacterium]|nr:DegQ family serine endoprotease [Pseudomonadales bacterium]